MDIPYQAYRSKRHSRSISANSSSTASPSSVRPTSVVISSPPPLSLDEKQDVSPLSSEKLARPNSQPSPALLVGHHLNTNSSEGDTSNLAASNGVTGAKAAVVLMPSSAASQSSAPGPSTKAAHARPTSTFRRVPLRTSRSPLPSSPLGLLSRTPPTHSPSPSVASTPSPLRATGLLPALDKTLPHHDPSSEPHTPRPAPSPSPAHGSETSSPFVERKPSPSSKPTALAIQATPTHAAKPINNHNGSAIAPKPILTTLTEQYQATPSNHRLLAPYRPGFQPKGVCHSLTDDFISLRCIRQNGEGPHAAKRVERTKLERRLEKLISLHFPLPSPVVGNGTDQAALNPEKSGSKIGLQAGASTQKFPSTFDFDTIKSMDASSIWRSVLGGRTKDSLRDMEQRITPWQDDSVANRCPLCRNVASFHPITNRKHHCRLCGKIICALPPKKPHRPVTCSLLFVLDLQSRMLEEVGEGVDYGVRKRRNSRYDGNPIAVQDGDDDKFLKAVRICRECRPVLLCRNYRQESLLLPSFVQLHNVLINLEREIESMLPQFQELILSLSHDDLPTKEASAARKRLLEAFAEYDAMAKRIYQLPCPNSPGNAQRRVQTAILARANTFLQKNMFPLKSLPAEKLPMGVPKPGLSEDVTSSYAEDIELAGRLQPLLEQEALLETFIEEAENRRKFEDVKTLKSNLGEIRREIQRVGNPTGLEASLVGKTL